MDFLNEHLNEHHEFEESATEVVYPETLQFGQDDQTMISNVTDLYTVEYQPVIYPSLQHVSDDETVHDPFNTEGTPAPANAAHGNLQQEQEEAQITRRSFTSRVPIEKLKFLDTLDAGPPPRYQKLPYEKGGDDTSTITGSQASTILAANKGGDDTSTVTGSQASTILAANKGSSKIPAPTSTDKNRSNGSSDKKAPPISVPTASAAPLSPDVKSNGVSADKKDPTVTVPTAATSISSDGDVTNMDLQSNDEVSDDKKDPTFKWPTTAAASTTSDSSPGDGKNMDPQSNIGISDDKKDPQFMVPTDATATAASNSSNGDGTTNMEPTSFTTSGVATIEQLMSDILEAPAPLPPSLRRNGNIEQQAPPGAFRAIAGGQRIEQVSQLHKGGMDVLARRYRDTDHSILQSSGDDNSQDSMLEQAEEGAAPPDNNESNHNNFQDERRERVAITGELMTDTMQGKKLSYWTIAGAIGLLVSIIIIAIVVGVTTSKDKTSQEEVDDTTSAEEIATSLYTSSLEDVFPTEESLLSDETRQAILSENGQSPQVQAFQWLAEDENWQNYGMPQLQQRFALATIYYATGGPKWFDHVQNSNSYNLWLDYSTHECSWYGMPNVHGRPKCSNYTAISEASLANPWDAHYDYQSLQLGANPRLLLTARNAEARLRGTLVPELALLTNLRELDVEHQSIKGTIPNELTQLSNTLQFIYLTKCFFTGTIPAQLFLSSRSLFLSHNPRLTSSIPAIGASSKMAQLKMTETNLQGTIPTELGLATGLEELLLNGNDLKGPIPSELGQLSSLKVLDLTDNELSGSIPLEIGHAHQLQILRLGTNFDLEGTLPISLALLSNLQVLDIFKNSIEGALWPELFYATSDFNDTSAVTASWPKLTTLIVTENGLTGPIPSEIGLSRSLKGLFLAGNRFESQLPTELGLLSHLACLGIAQNQFTGQLPPVGIDTGLLADVNADLSSSSDLRVNFVSQCAQN
ncbi:LRR receptor-like serine threonine-protein kinase [Seminavis robusta]|uniref:LRR receptor-like serine threonine-protein kinase n=1 Tax=Seminavis robusta TaxID=568900 RepID=A0A9N8HNK8_9STRA|nr:LRR receptor-like serine threonine-protein kinase [Seminavis robusta]|eukprot:Sro995_g229130.1 LRR receptor-like serine threonine-protein kinase (977) ;mRNA; f:4109-7039